MINISRYINVYPRLGMSILILSLIIVSVPDASASINLNFTNVTPRNYAIPDAVLNSNNFVILTGGNIEMPSITLKFGINKTLVSGTKSLALNTSPFGPRTTSFPDQKVYVVSGATAAVTYTIDASNNFASTQVNVSVYKQISNNVPFFSDLSIALLKFSDLKHTWNDDTKVMDELLNTVFDDQNKVSETQVPLDASGNSGPITQNLAAGNYLILVTKGTDPKNIITWNVVKVMPFSSTIKVWYDSAFAPQGLDLTVNILLSGAPSDNYTYITSIINRSDYADNIGNINISWNSGTLAQATRVNGTVLGSATSLTDIIPRSNISRTTTGSTSAILTLKTGSLPAGSYFVNTAVFNSTNLTVGFDQTLLTLQPVITTNIVAINGTGYVTANLTIPTQYANITINIPSGTRATLSDGVTPITSITESSLPSVNSTLEIAASGHNLKFVGKNMTLLPAGAIFTPYILLTFNYTQSDIPPGIGVGKIGVYTYNGSTNLWEELEVFDQGPYPGTGGGKFITVKVHHFSTFALMGTFVSGPTGGGPTGGGGGPGSGSGSGGGGVVTSEPYDNIAKAETQDKNLISNMSITYSFTTPELGVYEVAVTDTDNENAIALRAELLKGTSKLVTAAPPGTVYKNINMWAGTKRLKDILIRFKVDNTWISDNGLVPGDVKMVKWDGSTWIQLDTAQTTSDGTSTYYEAKSDTFSIFAISSVKVIAVPTTATPTMTAGITPTVTPPVKATPAPPTATLNLILYVFIVIVIAGAAVYFLVVKKKGK